MTLQADPVESAAEAGLHYVSDDQPGIQRKRAGSGFSYVDAHGKRIGDQATLLPDAAATIEATRVLAAEGFKVMAYTNDDLISALRLEDAGAVCVMPLASPIGSGLGMLNEFAIRTIKHRLSVPVIVDAGVGTASDAAVVMEQGVDGVLMNTGIAAAQDPVRMATAMRLAVDAGRLAYLAGRMPRREVAVPSSPTTGMLE